MYAASKAEAEQECWKFVKERKPQFTFNTIVPNSNFGKILLPGSGSIARWLIALWNNDLSNFKKIAPRSSYFSDLSRACVTYETDAS